MLGLGRKNDDDLAPHSDEATSPATETEKSLAAENNNGHPSQTQVKRATRTRFIWTLIASFLLLVTLVFLILVEIGQTNYKSSVLNDIYFLNVNLTNIFATSVPDASLIDSIAETIGLHDFYRVGLWNFCQGYNDEGVTGCGEHQTLYWFDPVSIILDELLAGATITLPAELTADLGLIETVSKWMFGLFLSGACLVTLMIPLQPISVFSRWWAFCIMFFTFLAALLTTVAAVIATVLFIIFRNVLTSVSELDIAANIGVEMFAFMWVAAAASVVAWIVQLCLCCCCASRRDVRTGRKRGNKKAWEGEEAEKAKAPGRFNARFGRRT